MWRIFLYKKVCTNAWSIDYINVQKFLHLILNKRKNKMDAEHLYCYLEENEFQIEEQFPLKLW